MVPGFFEELVVFWSSFFGAWLCPAWAQGEWIGGNGLEHAVDEFGLFTLRLGGGMDGGGPVAQGVEGTLEADALQRHVVEMRGRKR